LGASAATWVGWWVGAWGKHASVCAAWNVRLQLATAVRPAG
jgi:hypothetical protein